MSLPCCGNCRFGEKRTVSENGFESQHVVCRRYPPGVGMFRGGSFNHTFQEWPKLQTGEWCGEHQPAPEAGA